MLAGCAAANLLRHDRTSGRANLDGTYYLFDTEEHWAEFKYFMDMHLQNEVTGSSKNGYASWEDFWWHRCMALTPQKQENYQKYRAYIQSTRRRLELPSVKECDPSLTE